MGWRKMSINPVAIGTTIDNIKKSIKAGDPIIEKMRCVYILEDNPIVQCFMPYDFIDNVNTGINIKTLYLYTQEDK